MNREIYVVIKHFKNGGSECFLYKSKEEALKYQDATKKGDLADLITLPLDVVQDFVSNEMRPKQIEADWCYYD